MNTYNFFSICLYRCRCRSLTDFQEIRKSINVQYVSIHNLYLKTNKRTNIKANNSKFKETNQNLRKLTIVSKYKGENIYKLTKIYQKGDFFQIEADEEGSSNKMLIIMKKDGEHL